LTYFIHSQRQKAEARADSSPDPSSARESEFRTPPNFKNISRSFAKSFPQKIVFAKLRPLIIDFEKMFELGIVETQKLL